MNDETQNQKSESASEAVTAKKKQNLLPIGILISSLIFSGAWIYTSNRKVADHKDSGSPGIVQTDLDEKVLPMEGRDLPVSWGRLGIELVIDGVIDADKFRAIYEQRGEFTDEYERLLSKQNDGLLKITRTNAGYLLNLFWALGLANKNPVLDSGEITNKSYGNTKNFASTSGWTIARSDAMDHFSRHSYFDLTSEQQTLVDKISSGIFRPCCANSTHFPDCNHGMAMLGLLELMASQGVNEADMWKSALVVNSYWFPDSYITIANYLKNKNVDWENIFPQQILGASFSSARGFAKIASQVQKPSQSGGGCGVKA